MTEEKEYWHRFEDYRVANVDEYGDVTQSYTQIRHLKMEVLKKTKKGVWLKKHQFFTDKRFVLTNARKRWACPTIEEAKESFFARKNKQIAIYTNRIQRAQTAIALVKQGRLY